MTIKPEDLDKEQRARLVRLFEEYKPGERVRAACAIVDAMTDTEIAEGTVGVVREAGVLGCAPLFSVQWTYANGCARGAGPMVTSAENLEPVDRPRATPAGWLDQLATREGAEASAAIEAVLEEGIPHSPTRAARAIAGLKLVWKAPQPPPDMPIRVVDLGGAAPPAAAPESGAAAFVTLCRFDLPDIRHELAELERECRECFEDLEAVGVLRPGHEPPEGVAKVRARMPGLRASIHLIDVMLAKLRVEP
jgi:hypothetical protein